MPLRQAIRASRSEHPQSQVTDHRVSFRHCLPKTWNGPPLMENARTLAAKIPKSSGDSRLPPASRRTLERPSQGHRKPLPSLGPEPPSADQAQFLLSAYRAQLLPSADPEMRYRWRHPRHTHFPADAENAWHRLERLARVVLLPGRAAKPRGANDLPFLSASDVVRWRQQMDVECQPRRRRGRHRNVIRLA
jgi:hypothetical protein